MPAKKEFRIGVTAYNARGGRIGEFSTTPSRLLTDLKRNAIKSVDGFAVPGFGFLRINIRDTKNGVKEFSGILNGSFASIPATKESFDSLVVSKVKKTAEALGGTKMGAPSVTQRSLDR